MCSCGSCKTCRQRKSMANLRKERRFLDFCGYEKLIPSPQSSLNPMFWTRHVTPIGGVSFKFHDGNTN